MKNKVKNIIEFLGDLDTATQLVFYYIALLGFDTKMPTIAIVLGSFFGYIGFGLDVNVAHHERQSGNNDLFDKDGYRKEMIVIMGLTFFDFLTQWNGALTGEGVVLLFGYIAIQMIIVMTIMVLKDSLSRLPGIRSIAKWSFESVREKASSLVKSMINWLEILTSDKTTTKSREVIDTLEVPEAALSFTEEACGLIEKFKVSCAVQATSIYGKTFSSAFNALSYITDIMEMAHRRFDKEKGIEIEKTPFKEKLKEFFFSSLPTILIAILKFIHLAVGSAFGWKVVLLLLFYIFVHVVLDSVFKFLLFLCAVISVNIVFFPPIRKQIERWSNKVELWRKAG